LRVTAKWQRDRRTRAAQKEDVVHARRGWHAEAKSLAGKAAAITERTDMSSIRDILAATARLNH